MPHRNGWLVRYLPFLLIAACAGTTARFEGKVERAVVAFEAIQQDIHRVSDAASETAQSATKATDSANDLLVKLGEIAGVVALALTGGKSIVRKLRGYRFVGQPDRRRR